MRSTLDERLHFLNRAYFGIDDTDERFFDTLYDYENHDHQNAGLPEELVTCAVKKAYRDLQRKIPYVMNSTEMNRVENRRFKEMKELFKMQIHDHMVDILCYGNPMNIDPSAMIATVENIGNNHQGLFRNGERFTVGLAQKWVNMTLKYLWIMGAIDGDNLHAPIDRYILIAATDSDNGLGLGIHYDYLNNDFGNWPSWDNLDEYNDFQNRIRIEVNNRHFNSPIKWENEAWIEYAR